MKVYYADGEFKVPVYTNEHTKGFFNRVEDLLNDIRTTILKNSSIILYKSKSDETLGLLITVNNEEEVKQKIKSTIDSFFATINL
ncbi:hypothetical protein SU69_07510 [Thermosipho melanesiensis]|uniref:Uncharacterized protein n=2 Tax=Thermosipho melanesiensis TaxID=46541 RepID=A6LN23_THEM4|nr:hypothetical protein [Thermosipho melanesiensis]ABR31324.1 hypothetical protein Tmel_1477 [Thermosipho melanesiensis BI429]APT74922.1 hypothetical protein BW47_07865 [Thermosipho melanesiensis]OOC36348.1 hypothetical protein SU68_07580 [Thermosipho melanesiensis]OOC37166.1 hypothetical protein SU69_07510 [Thermosipho melanesiensis]OOC37918.1 hypothetical protein SU70_07520 [Thermosipho melanesiensis]